MNNKKLFKLNALLASKRAKLRRARFRPKSARVPFCRDKLFFFWESFFEQGAAKTEPSPPSLS